MNYKKILTCATVSLIAFPAHQIKAILPHKVTMQKQSNFEDEPEINGKQATLITGVVAVSAALLVILGIMSRSPLSHEDTLPNLKASLSDDVTVLHHNAPCCGLSNCSASCYMASMIQLIAASSLRDLILGKDFLSSNNKLSKEENKALLALREIINMMIQKSKTQRTGGYPSISSSDWKRLAEAMGHEFESEDPNVKISKFLRFLPISCCLYTNKLLTEPTLAECFKLVLNDLVTVDYLKAMACKFIPNFSITWSVPSNIIDDETHELYFAVQPTTKRYQEELARLRSDVLNNQRSLDPEVLRQAKKAENEVLKRGQAKILVMSVRFPAEGKIFDLPAEFDFSDAGYPQFGKYKTIGAVVARTGHWVSYVVNENKTFTLFDDGNVSIVDQSHFREERGAFITNSNDPMRGKKNRQILFFFEKLD
jgi:hypothetical protein